MRVGRGDGWGSSGRGLRLALVRELGLGLVAAGVVVLLFVAYDLVGTNFAEQSSQARLARQFSAALWRPASAMPRGGLPAGGTSSSTAGQRASLSRRVHGAHEAYKPGAEAHSLASSSAGRASAAKVAAPLPLPPPGGALDHLVVPAIGVNRYVVEGVAEQDLQMGPGHYPGTPLPGQLGNVGIAGHRTTFGAPFFRLNELRKGDLVYLTDVAGTTWVYSVQAMWVVYPDDVAVLGPTRQAELTLTTCNPRFWATTRLIVRAGLVGRLAQGAKLVGLTAELPTNLAALERARGQAKGAKAVASGGRAATPELLPADPLPAASTAGALSRAAGTDRAAGATGPSRGSGAGKQTAFAHDPVVGPVDGLGRQRPGTEEAASNNRPVVSLQSLSGLGGGAGAWVGAFGWGALALAAWVLTRVLAARRRRYAKAGLVLAGALVCLVPLWFAFGAVVGLLPANF